jgi:hypothetical protein
MIGRCKLCQDNIAAIACFWFQRLADSICSACRRGPGRAAVAVLATAPISAALYAFVYDLTLVAATVRLVAAEYWSMLSAV